MRKIKFRAWRKSIMHGGISLESLLSMAGASGFSEGAKSKVNWMQFTGLTDKNGVEVYEGDIVDIHQTVNGCNIFIVEWNKLGWSVKYGCNMITPRFYEYDVSSLFEPCKFTGEVDFEVIGNIHQNPELLEQQS